MAVFSIPDVAFSGIRIVRERPAAALYWGALQLVVSLIMGALIVTLAGPALIQLQAAGAAPAASQNPAQSLALLSKLLPMYAAMAPVSFIFYAVMFGAMNRAVLKSEDHAFGYLRVGPDELRQLAVLLILSVCGFAVYMAVIVVMAILLGIVAAAVAAIAGLGPDTLSLIIVPVLVVGVVSLFLWLGARLSLAPAQTLATGKINPFGSWALTRGMVWPILGVYALVWVLAGVIMAAIVVISAAAAAAMGVKGDAFAFVFTPDLSSLSAYFAPARLVNLVLGAAASALTWPLLLMPGAEIYRRVASPAGRAAEVFS
jgi:hypothetical protein